MLYVTARPQRPTTEATSALAAIDVAPTLHSAEALGGDLRSLLSAPSVVSFSADLHNHLRARAFIRSIKRDIPKRAIDVVLGTILLIAFAPVVGTVALLVRMTSPGPVLFRQKRVGRRGELFTCLKFRTMRTDADRVLYDLLAADPVALHEFNTTYKLTNDIRITRIGRFLRSTSLDELPQLVNVLRSEMSLVGPRPMVPEELPRYGDRAALVLQMKPGLTGLWQTMGRSRLSYSERVELDCEYVLHSSLIGDLRILVNTISAVAQRDGSAR